MSAPEPGTRRLGLSTRRRHWTPCGPISACLAPAILVPAVLFAILLYVRPLLRAASSATHRPLHDPYNAAFFVLKDSYIGHDFLSSWQWTTMNDPTNGRVNYVDQQTALASNLSFASDRKFVMRADAFNIADPYSRGRNSVRIQSNAAYDESVVVLDIAHMPEGCGTWPAFWSLSQNGPWPHGGEIDIIEGVNQNDRNLASLHTLPSCSMPDQRWMSGKTNSVDCDAKVNYNQGCGVMFDKPASYGTAFNNAGGGFYVLARTKSWDPAVRIWFWSRNDPDVPPEVRNAPIPRLFGAPSIYPAPSWGTPQAEFPLFGDCDYAAHFDPHAFVFDLTFCGDWAGTAYSTSGCPGNCVDFVNNNPYAFENAYWEINALRIYTPV